MAAVMAAGAWLAGAGPSAAQEEILCADPRGFCGALIRPVCLQRIESERLESEADAECGGALLAYRACLGDAVACPNVVDPLTPVVQPDARAPCGDGSCEDPPLTPIVKEAPPDPDAPEDEAPEERIGQSG
ncbi:MAG: hypothetical protein AAGM38_00215 [Pseudomonadota bacterium]